MSDVGDGSHGQACASQDFAIGLIIPTFNRRDVLETCLAHLERQNFPHFEVVVVDDGSTDDTPEFLASYQQRTSLNLACIRQENSGPARARNVGIAALRAPICLMIGDDIFATPDLVAAHLQLHQLRPEQNVAALGLTQWCPSGQKVTPFMRWLDDSGVQFAYQDLLRGVKPDWKHFYTSNLSLKTNFLRENPFNEDFTKAAAEDLELGFRLERTRALELVLVPAALAYHLHPTTFLQACRRMVNVGAAMRVLHQLWPDSAPARHKSRLRQAVRALVVKNPWILRPVTKVANLVTSFRCPNPIMKFALACHAAVGYATAPPPAAQSRQYPALSRIRS